MASSIFSPSSRESGVKGLLPVPSGPRGGRRGPFVHPDPELSQSIMESEADEADAEAGVNAKTHTGLV